MGTLYFLALLPVCFGAILFLCGKTVCWKEWLTGTAIALATAGAGHFAIHLVLTGDTETWSGQISHGVHIPAWTEKYKEAIYKDVEHKDKDGNTHTTREFSHYETRTDYHPESFTLESNIPSSHGVGEGKWKEVVAKLGGKLTPQRGSRSTGKHDSHMIAGDPYDYHLQNTSGWIEPVNVGKFFENRIKNSHSLFRSRRLAEAEKKNLFPYPNPTGGFESNRLLGVLPAAITPLAWDQLNARLGPTKRVNIILAGFPSSDSALADNQLALWAGGKKNDLMLFYGPGWSRVLGWSESELCKANLQTLLLTPNSPTLLQDIEKEIQRNYQIVDWNKKFAYISVEPTFWQIITFLGILVISQSGIYYYFHKENPFQSI